jgi:Leucine-rich repeat (LRR) protein
MWSLKALIANNNAITSFAGIAALAKINTLVLSHNQITAIEGIKSLKLLKKLSLAHNQIRVLPDLREHPMLEELRLNDNKIQRVPETIDRSPALKVPAATQHKSHALPFCCRSYLPVPPNFRARL